MEQNRSVNFGNALFQAVAGGAATWTLSRWGQLRLACVAAFGLCVLKEASPEEGRSWAALPLSGVYLIAILDQLGCCPVRLSCRLGVDSLLLLTTGLGGCRALSLGLKEAHQEGNWGAGAVAIGIGLAALVQALLVGRQIYQGVPLFATLDPVQQFGTLRNRALHTLPGAANRPRAVVVDGLWQSQAANWPSHGAAETVYSNFNVRYYRVGSVDELYSALGQAQRSFGGEVDLLFIQGHANPSLLSLGQDYDFTGSWLEAAMIHRYVKPGGQLVLFGCNTATGAGSLAEKLRLRLSSVEVVGIAAYLNPFWTTQWVAGGRFHLGAHFPASLVGWAGWQSALVLPA